MHTKIKLCRLFFFFFTTYLLHEFSYFSCSSRSVNLISVSAFFSLVQYHLHIKVLSSSWLYIFICHSKSDLEQKKRKMDSPQRIILHFTGFQKKPIIRNLLTLKYRYLKYVFVQLLILLTNIVLKIVKWFFLCKTKKSIKMQITSPYLSFLYTQRKMTLFWGTLWGKEKKEEDQSRFTIFFYIQAPTISHYYKQYKTGYSRLPGFFFTTECWGFSNPNFYLGQKDTFL